MRTILSVILLVAAQAISSNAHAVTSDESVNWEQRLRFEYSAAFKRFKLRYAHVYGVVKWDRVRRRKGKLTPDPTKEVGFYCDGDYMKVLRYRGTPPSDKRPEPYVRLTCSTPAYRFTGTQVEESTPMILSRFAGPERPLVDMLLVEK